MISTLRQGPVERLIALFLKEVFMHAAKKQSHTVAAVPFHVFLTRALDEANLTNPDVAQRLGYTKANVVSMIRTGSMKVPLNKLPELADMLDMSRIDLLMIALNEYDPGFLEALKRIIGEGQMVGENEMRLLTIIRSVMPSGEFDLTTSDDFVQALTALVGAGVEAHKQDELRPDPEAKVREGKNATLNKELGALLQRQSRERAKLYERLLTEVGPSVMAHRMVA
jgi:hypothetical protein